MYEVIFGRRFAAPERLRNTDLQYTINLTFVIKLVTVGVSLKKGCSFCHITRFQSFSSPEPDFLSRG
jgi:hypothetical protein